MPELWRDRTIAIVGAAGQLGSWLVELLGDRTLTVDLPEFDVTDRDAVLRWLRVARPKAIVNCAAFTAVDRAEREAEQCFAVNAQAVEYLVEGATELDCPLVQISTDYVFGQVSFDRRPWREDDLPQPRGAYAESKRAGELAAQRADRHLVIRTCGLYGHASNPLAARSFVEAVLQKAESGERLRVVVDQHCSPSYARHVAAAIAHLLHVGARGILHVTNTGATTWYHFAREIVACRGVDVPIEPITTAEYNAAAPRPAFSVLDTSRYAGMGGPPMPDVVTALHGYLAWRDRTLAGAGLRP